LFCTSCHRAHYNVPAGTPATTIAGDVLRDANGARISLAVFHQGQELEELRRLSNHLGAQSPTSCYRCHGDMADLEKIAGPHQIAGPNGFNCTTCHDSHGNIVESSRTELCMQCHKADSPTMAWHSSTHALMGVACTDCHNPHPRAGVQKFVQTSGVDLAHTHLSNTKRRAMSVQEPDVCFKCHGKIFGQTRLPSHHPIREGKMVCSDCHDGHGQREGNLKAEHTNLLCLRCHVGHRDGNHGGGARVNIDTIPELRKGFYSDCTQFHSQIHGSDLPTPHFPAMFR
jgi:predicted CXXCH cytochrome family protein